MAVPRDYLKDYQKLLGLKPNGVIDRATKAAMMKDLGWVDEKSFVHALGQGRLESNNFTAFRENLNYTPENILKTFNSKNHARFSQRQAQVYGRTASHLADPEMIANIAYAGRLGNGDIKSGDGWRYRGGLGQQVTFKNNWVSFFKTIGKPPTTDPDSLRDEVRLYFMSFKWFFDENHLHRLCTSFDDSCILSVSRAINVGTADTHVMPNDWKKREQYTRELARATGMA